MRCDRSTMTQNDIDNGRVIAASGSSPRRRSKPSPWCWAWRRADRSPSSARAAAAGRPHERRATCPLHVFRFQVDFLEDALDGSAAGNDVALCSGAFSECTGLEATMEPKVIKEGGRNYGAAQRGGPVTFATVVLKRGMTTSRRPLAVVRARLGQERLRLPPGRHDHGSSDPRPTPRSSALGSRRLPGSWTGCCRSSSSRPTSTPRAARSESRSCTWPTRA